jgi:hypothetical protein
MVQVWKPMVDFCSSTLSSSIWNELEIQIIFGPPSQKAWKHEKFTNISKVIYESPTLLTIINGGWSSWQIAQEWLLESKISSTQHLGDFKMNWYACWITYDGVKLIHIQ